MTVSFLHKLILYSIKYYSSFQTIFNLLGPKQAAVSTLVGAWFVRCRLWRALLIKDAVLPTLPHNLLTHIAHTHIRIPSVGTPIQKPPGGVLHSPGP